MPATDKLQWFDISDMTAGVWDESAAKGRFAAPPNAFRQLQDYQPIKGGGLRAYTLATAVDMTGIAAGEVCTGVFARNGLSRGAGVGGTGTDSTDLVLVTKNTSDFKYRIWRRDGTVASPAWSLRFTTSADTGIGHQITDFAYFLDSAGVEWYLISIFGKALYSMRIDTTVASNTGNDGLVAALITTITGPVTVAQARILIGGGNNSRIYYSSVGLTTGLSLSNFLDVAPNRSEANVSILNSLEPSDLLVGKEGAPWVTIAGDVTSTSTPVREMGDDHHARQDKQQCPRVPGGIAFIEGRGRVFITDGRQFNSISDQINAFTLNPTPGMVGPGTLGYLNSQIFAPGGTKVRVYDFDAGCWFDSLQAGCQFAWGDPYGGNMFVANHSSSSATVYIYGMFSAINERVSTGVIQTVPYADKNGRNLDIREVQLFVNTYATSEFKIELLDENDATVATRYITVTGSVHEVVVAKFPYSKSEYLSVKITPRSVDGSTEAPSIERIRIGFSANNLIT